MTNNNNIGLYFGSFNPVHIGHLALANYLAENTHLNELWFVISPQNPHKNSEHLIDANHRLKMLEKSIQSYPSLKVCDIELHMPTPSYTYATLNELAKQYPNNIFTIIMGGDNLAHLKRWKNAEDIMGKFPIMVYPRPGFKINESDKSEDIQVIDAPVFNIDSTTIRQGIKNGKQYPFLVPQEAYTYILQHKLYK